MNKFVKIYLQGNNILAYICYAQIEVWAFDKMSYRSDADGESDRPQQGRDNVAPRSVVLKDLRSESGYQDIRCRNQTSVRFTIYGNEVVARGMPSVWKNNSLTINAPCQRHGPTICGWLEFLRLRSRRCWQSRDTIREWNYCLSNWSFRTFLLRSSTR